MAQNRKPSGLSTAFSLPGHSLTNPHLIYLLVASLFFATVTIAAAQAGDPEVGLVRWQRDFDGALRASQKSGKPLFVLFQEVPGCHGCKKFGQTVLVEPLIVEAIESLFVPVLVYNNRGGKDARLLKRYREPAWNFQVVRFLDSGGQDIIPRKDKVWSKRGIIGRMIKTLEKKQRPIPLYLSSLRDLHSDTLKEVSIAMHCFWTGERVLGALPGVIKTQAGWYDGREVTRVWYNAEKIALVKIVKAAIEVDSAEFLYLEHDMLSDIRNKEGPLYGLPKGRIKPFRRNEYREAKSSDQKRQLMGTAFDRLALNEYQLTKINAFARVETERALKYLSPRQRRMLRRKSS